MRKKQVPEHAWNADIFILCGTRAELNSYLRRNCHDKDDTSDHIDAGDYGHYTQFVPHNVRSRSQHYICVNKDLCATPHLRREVLAHEIVHCVFRLFADKGMATDVRSDEAFAYFLEWLFKHGQKVVQ